MKRAITLIIVLAILALAAAVFAPGLLEEFREVTGTAPESTTVYKWKDADGVWHVTDEPPPPGVEYQEQEYLHDANIMPAPGADEDVR